MAKRTRSTFSEPEITDIQSSVLQHLGDIVSSHSDVYQKVIKDTIEETGSRVGSLSISTLEHLLGEYGSRLYEAVCTEVDPTGIHLITASKRRGMFLLDSIGVRILRESGPYGRKAAALLEAKSRDRWKSCLRGIAAGNDGLSNAQLWHVWCDLSDCQAAPPILHVLASALWKDRASKAKQAALSRTVLDISGSALWWPGRHVSEDGGAIQDRSGRLVAHIIPADSDLISRVSEDLTRTGTLTGHRLFRWLVSQGYQQRYVDQKKDFRRIVVPGGFIGLAACLASSGSKAADEIHRSLEVLQSAHIRLPHGDVGGLLSWQLRRAAPHQRAELAIVLGDALLPDYVTALRKGGETARRARMLVPLPATLPPLAGRPRQYPAQATMQILTLVELRDDATALVETGAVQISKHRWRELAQQAGVSESLVEAMLEAWLYGNDGSPPFLARVEKDAFTLAVPTYQSELEMLLEAGRREIRGSSWAKRRNRFLRGGLPD